jgi:hypothetical protein
MTVQRTFIAAALTLGALLGSAPAEAQVQPGPQSMWFAEVNISAPDQQAWLSLVNGQNGNQCFTVTAFTASSAPQNVYCVNARRRHTVDLGTWLPPGHYGILVQAYGLVGSAIAIRPVGDPFGPRVQHLLPDRQDTPFVQ